MTDFVGAAFVVVFMLGITVAISRQFDPRERTLLFVALSAHLGTGALLGPVMRDYLGGSDMLGYYRVGTNIVAFFYREPVETMGILGRLLLQIDEPLPFPDAVGVHHGSTGAMIALTAISMLFTGGGLAAVCMALAASTFLAKVRIYRVFRAELDPSSRRATLACCVLIPSVVFWSSGLIKEAFALIGLSLLFRELHRFYRGQYSIWGTIIALFGALLIATIKGYVLVPFGVAAAATVLLARTRPGARKVTRATQVLLLVGGVGFVAAAGLISTRFDPENLPDEAARLQELGEQAEGGSNYTLAAERSTAGQVAAIPVAIVTALFRPWIFEATNAQMAANGLETLVFTWLFIGALRSGRTGYQLVRQEPILIFCLVFSLVLAIGVGLASTNLGTLSRYRMPMMPFLWALVTVVGRSRKGAVRQEDRLPVLAHRPRTA